MKGIKITFGISLAVIFLLISYLIIGDFDTDETIVAVLDTGINEKHKVFKGKLIKGYNFVNWNNDTTDLDGHGTGIAGLVVQETKEYEKIKIMPVKVIGGGDKFKFTSSIIYSVIKGADVINMSFSADTYERSLIELAIKYGQKKGVVFVGAAGNKGRDDVSFPARVSDVFAIGNVDVYGKFVKSSNYGDRIDFVVNGARGALPLHNDNTKYRDAVGTSLSSARFSGYVAYLLNKNPGWSKDDLEEHFIKHTDKIELRQKGSQKTFSFVPMKELGEW